MQMTDLIAGKRKCWTKSLRKLIGPNDDLINYANSSKAIFNKCELVDFSATAAAFFGTTVRQQVSN